MENSRNGAKTQVDAKAEKFVSSKILAYNLRMLRDRRGLTQEQVALAAGVGVRTYLAVEAGECNPTLGTLEKLARFFRVVVSRLLNLGIINLEASEEIFRKKVVDTFSESRHGYLIRDFEGFALWGNQAASDIERQDFSKCPLNLLSSKTTGAQEFLRAQILAEKMGIVQPYLDANLGPKGDLNYFRIYPTLVFSKNEMTPIYCVNYLTVIELDCEENYYLVCSKILECV